MGKKITYSEPAGFFPEEIRKEFKLGEYADDAKKPAEKKPADKKPVAKRTGTAKTKTTAKKK